jgi:hypothetical protein
MNRDGESFWNDFRQKAVEHLVPNEQLEALGKSNKLQPESSKIGLCSVLFICSFLAEKFFFSSSFESRHVFRPGFGDITRNELDLRELLGKALDKKEPEIVKLLDNLKKKASEKAENLLDEAQGGSVSQYGMNVAVRSQGASIGSCSPSPCPRNVTSVLEVSRTTNTLACSDYRLTW